MIDAALSMITGTLWPYIAAAFAALAGMVAVYAKGRKDAKNKQEKEQADAYRETRKRVDAADTGGDDDEWLRKRAGRK